MSAEKRALDQEESILNVSSVIVDIEGTTTSISFVHDTLFPYVREHLNDYVKSNWADSEFQEDLKALKEQAQKDESDKVEGVVAIPEGEEDAVREATIKNVLWQMDNDRKTGALKQLQGHIWRKAYEKGEVVGHIYDDVHEGLKSWVDLGKKIYVYSSGSVEAQKLLFGHTKEGDLLKLFSGHFDTAVGAKTEVGSYTKILEKIEKTGEEAKTVLFLTDVPKEATAAVESGMLAVLVSREGNAALTDDAKASFRVISSFADLAFEGKCKRRKVSESDDATSTNNDASSGKIDVSDVEMKEVDKKVDEKQVEDADSKQESKEEKTSDTKAENETSMDTSEVVEQKSEVKDQECAKKPVEATENGTEEKSESAPEKSSQSEKPVETASSDAATSTVKNDKVSDETEKDLEPCEKKETKENTSADDVESKKMDDGVAENEKVGTTDEKSTESATAEKQESASNEKDLKVTAQNGSADEVSAEKEKDDKCAPKKEEEDKSAKQEAPENAEVNDSGIADVDKSVNQSEKSDDTKAVDEVKTEETVVKEAEVAKTDVEANGEKSVETVKKETTNGEVNEAESKDQLKNGEAGATDETKLNGTEKKPADTNGCAKSEAVQNGVEAKENGNVNGDKHEETDNSKTDKANGKQTTIEEKKLDNSINNTTETVAV